MIYHDDNFPGRAPPGNGVLMADGFITASYNALNQPIAIWSPTYAGTPNYVWFGFDPLGRCVKRWVGPLVNGDYPPPETNPATYFLYDGWNMIEEGPGGGGVTRVYAHGAEVDEIIASSTHSTGAVLFHHYDALGNCILLSDGAGNLFEQYDYEAFGKPYFYETVGTNIPSSPWKNRYLGKGREWLSDLKLYDNRHRLYQPELGRFLQPDPIGFGGESAKNLAISLGSSEGVTPPIDYNLYRYCHNDPVNKTDPLGLQTVLVQVPPVLLEAAVPRAIMPRQALPRELVEQAVRLNDGRNRVPLPDGRAVDLRGRSHFDKVTGQRIPTPHVHEPKAPFKPPYQGIPPGRNAVPRPAKPDDIRDVIRHLLDRSKKKE